MHMQHASRLVFNVIPYVTPPTVPFSPTGIYGPAIIPATAAAVVRSTISTYLGRREEEERAELALARS